MHVLCSLELRIVACVVIHNSAQGRVLVYSPGTPEATPYFQCSIVMIPDTASPLLQAVAESVGILPPIVWLLHVCF